MQWGPDSDAKFFMHVLKIHNVKLDYGALAIAMGNDVTPKALVHRVAKLRSMAEDASTPVAGASSGLGLPQPNKRAPAKRAPRTAPAPAGKKAANKTPNVAGAKRTAAGTVKNGNGKEKGNGGSPLQNVFAAYNGGEDEGGEDEEGEEGKVEVPSKKVKATIAGVALEDESTDAEEGEGGVRYA